MNKPKAKAVIIRLICVFLSMLLLPVVYSYPYWGSLSSVTTQGELEVGLGDYPFDFENPIDRLPSGVPQYIIERLNEISLSASEKELERLVEAVARILDYPPFHEQINVVIAQTADDLFNEYMPPLQGGDFLIYLTQIDGEYEISLVHISENSPIYSNVEQLLNALSQPWTGYNQISNVWLRGNLYDTFNSPLEYGDRAYLLNYNGPSGTPPNSDREAWFEIPINYEYNPVNTRYYRNYIVRHQGQFYIGSQVPWGNAPTQTGWSPWSVIPDWQNGLNYMPQSVVVVQNNGVQRFFRALISARDIEPNEDSCRAGIWQEINNGWIGRNGDTDIKSYYFEHNTYQAGTTIIFGVSPKMKYSYYTARGAVPPSERPVIVGDDGVARLNSQYWEVFQ